MKEWNEEKVSGVLQVLRDAFDARYELEYCARGVYTESTTYPELGTYLKELASRLEVEADRLFEQEEDPEDEDEDEY